MARLIDITPEFVREYIGANIGKHRTDIEDISRIIWEHGACSTALLVAAEREIAKHEIEATPEDVPAIREYLRSRGDQESTNLPLPLYPTDEQVETAAYILVSQMLDRTECAVAAESDDAADVLAQTRWFTSQEWADVWHIRHRAELRRYCDEEARRIARERGLVSDAIPF